MSGKAAGAVTKLRVAVLVSGNGGNLQALLDAARGGDVSANVALVLSSDPGARALLRAKDAGVPALAVPYARDPALGRQESRNAYDARLAEAVLAYEPDYVFLLGWMRILGNAFISKFPGRIVNLHPALPGTFPGTHAIERAWEACRRGEITETGAMTHFVPDEGVDSGPVILSERVAIGADETLESLETRMHETEHALVVKTARLLAETGAHGRGPSRERYHSSEGV
ncbi:phosphoribosylglycinamide formyltransferase [bacterium]|nr:phosphoribosylglycinamide formyltransferase [bacterium]